MRPLNGPPRSSMVGYRRQKYLVIWVLAILVLIILFYYYFGSDGKTADPLTTTSTSDKEEVGLKPYNNVVLLDSVSIM